MLLVPAYVTAAPETRVFGLTTAERLARQAPKAGLAIVDDPTKAEVILSGACVYGASVLKALTGAAPGTILADDDGRLAALKSSGTEDADAVEAGGTAPDGAKSGAELAGRYDKQLRKRADPMVARLNDVKAVEQQIFDATYKGVTDFVTKHVWPMPALAAVRLCVRFSLSPNQVTYASGVLVLAAFWFFWTGQFGLGFLAAWLMTFLDTVDGKLARATLTSSKFGDFMDHGIDLVHPPFWWWAWAVGCAATGQAIGDGGLALMAILAGYVLQRVEEGIFIARFKIEMHIWRPFDSFFRKITARRNPNLVILMIATLLGAPREGFIAVAIWTVFCLLVHLVQIVQAFVAVRNGPLRSWMQD
jgi:phosphatidylglycerophosphate synthase